MLYRWNRSNSFKQSVSRVFVRCALFSLKEIGQTRQKKKNARCVAIGSFGHVSIVQHEETSVVYALKTIEKAELIRMDEVESALFERKVLHSLDLKCVVKL
jgi:hypothetical protein